MKTCGGGVLKQSDKHAAKGVGNSKRSTSVLKSFGGGASKESDKKPAAKGV